MRYELYNTKREVVANCQNYWMAVAIVEQAKKDGLQVYISDLKKELPAEGKDVILRDLVIRILERKIAINCLQTELLDSDKKIWSIHWTKVLEAKRKALAGMRECQRLDEECLDAWRC